MGAEIPDNSVEFPDDMQYLWDMHREARFSCVINDDGEKALSARESLSLSSLISYSDFVGVSLNKNEINAIMSIDSIFDRHVNGNG